MRFYLSLLLSVILSLCVRPSAFAMMGKEDTLENNALIPIVSLSPARVTATSSAKEENLSDLQGFQSYYYTAITDEEWEKANQRLATVAQSAASSIEIISHWLTEYESACREYYHFYKMLLKNLTKTLKKSDLKSLLNPLFNYVVAFDYLSDNLRPTSCPIKLDYDGLQADILPIIQPTFNLYMQAYETLSGNITTSLGSLDYMKVRYGFPTHLFYKRDEKGFFIFTIHHSPNEKFDQDLYETYIPYQNKKDKFFEHYLFFTLDPTDRKPLIETRSGLILQRGKYDFGKESAEVSIIPYYGADALAPFTTELAISFTTQKKAPLIENNLTQTSPVAEDVLDMAVLPPQIHVTHIDYQESEKLREVLPGKARESLVSYVSELLGDKDKVFFPFLTPGLETLECEYLFLSDIKAQLDRKEDKHIQPFLLEYLLASFPDHSPDETLAAYEKVLLEAYEDEEYAEEIRKQQTERSKMVAAGGHYVKQKKGKKENKPNKKSASRSSKNISKNDVLTQSDELARHHAKERAKERLMNLQQAAMKRTIPEKFRKFLRAVNIATQELSRLDTPIRAELNKSSHGNIVVEGSKPITLVRPHGLRDTISKKNAKGILTGLINTYFEKIAEQK